MSSADKHRRQVNHPNPTILQHGIFMEVLRERERQTEEWGDQCHGDTIWSLILGEKYGEVQKAVLEKIGSDLGSAEYFSQEDQMKAKLIQMLAVGFQWLEHKGVGVL